MRTGKKSESEHFSGKVLLCTIFKFTVYSTVEIPEGEKAHLAIKFSLLKTYIINVR